MTVQEQNKATVRHLLSEGDKRGPGILDEVCAPDYKMYMPSNGTPIDLEEHKVLWQAFVDGFPDLNHTIHEAIAEGEWVATRETLRGTNTGEFQGRPPTGKKVEFDGVCLWRFADGKLVEYRVDADLLGLNEQLGMELKERVAN
jgi:predicted ester cyclase